MCHRSVFYPDCGGSYINLYMFLSLQNYLPLPPSNQFHNFKSILGKNCRIILFFFFLTQGDLTITPAGP